MTASSAFPSPISINDFDENYEMHDGDICRICNRDLNAYDKVSFFHDRLFRPDPDIMLTRRVIITKPKETPIICGYAAAFLRFCFSPEIETFFPDADRESQTFIACSMFFRTLRPMLSCPSSMTPDRSMIPPTPSSLMLKHIELIEAVRKFQEARSAN